jgi:hypothetical protein
VRSCGRSLPASLRRRSNLRAGSGLRSCSDLFACYSMRSYMSTLPNSQQTLSRKTLLPSV